MTSGNAYIVYINGKHTLILSVVFYVYAKLVSYPEGSIMGFEKGW